MIGLPLALAIPLVIVVGGALAAAGYAVGLTRFLRRLPAAARPASEPGAPGEPGPDPASAGPPGRLHTVILDGIAESGKSTLIHRLAFPCTERAALERLRATRQPMRTRTLPVCFEPAAGGDILHSLRFSDVSGERPDQIADTIDELHGEQRATAAGPRGRVIALWVWDMANTPRCRTELSPARMRVAYGTRRARELITGVVVFFNKVDLLEVDRARQDELVADEEAYLRGVIARCFDAGVPVVFHRGSALQGTGVTDCQGALYDAVGLGRFFRLADGEGGGGAAGGGSGDGTP